MRKITIIVVALAILLPVGYTGFWYYQAGNLKSSIQTSLDNAAQNIAADGGEISYSNIRTSGFPSNLNIIISDLAVQIGDNADDVAFSIESSGDITLGASLTNYNEMKITLPSLIKASAKVEDTIDTMEVDTVDPVITLHIDNENIFEILQGNAKSSTLDNFRRLTYTDQGSTSKSTSSNGLTSNFSHNSSFVDISIQNKEDSDHKIFNLALQTADMRIESTMDKEKEASAPLVTKLQEFYNKMGTADAAIELNGEIPTTMDGLHNKPSFIEIGNISFTSDLFSTAIKGSIHKTMDDFMPHGKIVISINKIKEFVDFYTYTATLAINEQKSTLSDEEQAQLTLVNNNIDKIKTSLIEILRKISDEPTATSNNLTITLSREKMGQDLKIGTLDLTEFMQEATSLIQEVTPPQGG